MARRKAPLISDELLDQLLAGRDPQSALGRDGLIDELKRALAERALNAEMDHHLDGEVAEGRSNSRNGYGRKTVLTETGKLPILMPRDRLATFDPQLIAKYRRPAGLRRQDRVDVRPRHDRPGDPGPFGRALRHRRLARSDQRRDLRTDRPERPAPPPDQGFGRSRRRWQGRPRSRFGRKGA